MSPEARNKPGKVHQISSASNPRIKSIRSLAMKKHRDETGTFLIEGMKLVRDALEQGWQVETVLYSEEAAKSNASISELAASIRTKGGDVLEVSDRLISSITRKDNPQSTIAVVKQQWVDAPTGIQETSNVWIALDRIRDPGNLGTIIRTADAAGVRGIILVGDTTDPYSFEASRATMGSIFNVMIAKLGQDEFLAWRKSWSGMVVGTHLKGAVDFRTVDYRSKPVLLLMGNEQQGLPQKLADCCDSLVLIPMAGSADSLNLAVATGVMLFQMGKSLPEISESVAR